MNLFSKLGGVVAALVTIISLGFSAPLAAQELEPTQQAAVYQDPYFESAVDVDLPNRKIQLVQPAVGLALKPVEIDLLLSDDCLIGPIGTSQALYDWAAKEGVPHCSKKFHPVGRVSTSSTTTKILRPH